MNRFMAVCVSIDQATWERLVIGVVFNHFAIVNAIEYIVIGQPVFFSFIVGVISDMNPTMTYGVNNILDVQLAIIKTLGQSNHHTSHADVIYWGRSLAITC